MRVRGAAVAAGMILVLAAVIALGPGLLRRDAIHYRWAGTLGSDLLEEPIGIALNGHRIFVSDAARGRIVVFDTSGALADVWGDSTGLELRRPMHLSLDQNGFLYVAEYLSDRVTILDINGATVRVIGGATGSDVGELDAPGGAVLLDGMVFVVDFYNHRVDRFGAGGAGVLGREGRLWRGRFHYPTDVAADDSLLYVADAYNHRIQVYRPNGEFVRKWGGPLGLGGRGGLRGWFRVDIGIDVANGNVFVADFDNDRVQVFTDRGRYLGQMPDSLELPTDVAVTPSGVVYVVDFGHARVVRFEPVRER